VLRVLPEDFGEGAAVLVEEDEPERMATRARGKPVGYIKMWRDKIFARAGPRMIRARGT